jgi:hypothetical protein
MTGAGVNDSMVCRHRAQPSAVVLSAAGPRRNGSCDESAT